MPVAPSWLRVAMPQIVRYGLWSLFLTQDKHMQTRDNAMKYTVKPRVNCDTVRPGSICLWQLNNPKIAVLD